MITVNKLCKSYLSRGDEQEEGEKKKDDYDDNCNHGNEYEEGESDTLI